MIEWNGKKVGAVYWGKKVIALICFGARKLWDAVKSCFGNGWNNNAGWSNDDGWSND